MNLPNFHNGRMC